MYKIAFNDIKKYCIKRLYKSQIMSLQKNMRFQLTIDGKQFNNRFNSVSSVIIFINRKLYKQSDKLCNVRFTEQDYKEILESEKYPNENNQNKFTDIDFYSLLESDNFPNIVERHHNINSKRIKIKSIKLDVKKCGQCYLSDKENNVNKIENIDPLQYLKNRHVESGEHGYGTTCYSCNKLIESLNYIK